MRLFAIISVIYILFLGVMPSISVAFSKEEVACCVDHCEEDNDGDECGICNPLFSCACYSGFLIYSNKFIIQQVKNIPEKNTAYTFSIPSLVYCPIWQPPKLTA